MNPHLLSALEKLKIGDIKSSMDQIRSLYGEVTLIKQEIETLFTELDSKVSLVSRKLDGPSTVSKLGTGIIASITNAGTVLNGTGTLFSKEVAIGNQIKIGSETVTVTGLDSLSPDIKMTVTPALAGSYINQIFAIIKTATKELLKGEFDFGELNGDAFNGVVRQGSSLETYGRMTQPADVVNVNFVQKQTTPIMVRAQNAIQRDGDNIVGPVGNRYTYFFNNTNIDFGSNVELTYSGVTSSPTNLVTRANLDQVHNAKGFIYFKFESQTINLATIPNPNEESNFLNNYFTLIGNSFVCNKPCLGLITASFSANTGIATDRKMALNWSINVNNVIRAKSETLSWSGSAGNNQNKEEITSTLFLMYSFIPGDKIDIPLSTTGTTDFAAPPNISVGILVLG
jgi:uncharacterized protein YycO